MDKRSMLLGLGMGIIIGALLMQLFIMGEQSSKQLEEMDNMINNNELPLEVIKRDGANANVEVNDEQELTEEPQQLEGQVEADREDGALPTPVVSEEDVHTPVENGQYSTDKQTAKTVLLRIYSGATVSETAEVLEKHNIIESKSQFANYTLGKKKTIRAGYFLVNEHSTNEEILEILTSIPVREETALDYIKNEQYDTIFSP